MRVWVGCFDLLKSSMTSEGLLGPATGGGGIGGRGGKSCWVGGIEKSGPFKVYKLIGA